MITGIIVCFIWVFAGVVWTLIRSYQTGSSFDEPHELLYLFAHQVLWPLSIIVILGNDLRIHLKREKLRSRR